MLSDSILKKLDELGLRLRHPASGSSGGLRRSKALGSSVEFSDFREYTPGDDIRRVDWNAYARFDRLFLKLFMEEREQRVSILVDASASMDFGEPSKWTAAKALAQALCYLALGCNDQVTVYALRDGGEVHTGALSARHQYPRAVDFLDNLRPSGDAALCTTVPKLRLPAGSGMSVLISDLLCDGGYERALQSLMYRKQELGVLQVLSPGELEPELEDAIELEDSETSERLTLTMSYDLIRRYRDTAQRFVTDAHDYCVSHGAAHALLVPSDPLEERLLHSLSSAGLIS